MTIMADKKINNSSQILLNSEFHLFLAPSPLLPDLKFLFSLAKNCKKNFAPFSHGRSWTKNCRNCNSSFENLGENLFLLRSVAEKNGKSSFVGGDAKLPTCQLKVAADSVERGWFSNPNRHRQSYLRLN